MARPVVRARALTKHFRYHHQRPGLRGALRSFVRRRTLTRIAVDELDLDVARGEVLGLLGRNGAGKTTTIKMLCGLVRPTAGELTVLGEEPARRRFSFLQQISVIFGQKSMLWWDLPAYDSLVLHQRIYDLDRAAFGQSVGQLSELLDLADLLTVPVRKLSLGQRMRCELALALLHRPRLLFADEPTIGLDVLGKAAVREFLQRANSELGTSIVLTSHDTADIASLCQRVMVIDAGRMRYDGDLTGLARSVRPRKRLTVTFAASPTVPSPVPTGCVFLDPPGHDAVRLEVERDQLTRVISGLAEWGELVDLEVTDAPLDEVMADVLAGEFESSVAATGREAVR